MQVTIEIEPQTFSLLQKVREKGVSLDEVLQKALDKFDDEKPFQQTVSADEWIKSLKEWANKPRELPELSNEASRRENIYEDRI